jgi:type IV pilus assembly protein PilP
MTRWYVCLICGVFIFSGMVGCSEEPSSSQQSKKTTAVKTPAKKQVSAPAVKAEVEKEVAFVYTTEGRRDPFVPLSRIRKPLGKTEEPATPLQKYDLIQFKLVGVIVGKGEPKAMVVAPDGKSYILAEGVKIGKNNGVIISISTEAVRVEEKYYDFSGNVIENIQEITVPKREGV